MNGFDKLEIDSPPETYEALARWSKTLKGVPGLTCEVGLRRAGGTVTIIDSFLENNDPRTHIAIDPYGNVLYSDIMGVHRSDYTNSMRNETLSALYAYAAQKKVDILFFNLEDSEFYNRFSDGVPVYSEVKQMINEFAFVHIDGQHDVNSVFQAARYFVYRMPKGGIIAFDNTNHYKHIEIENYIAKYGFRLIESVHGRNFYRNE